MTSADLSDDSTQSPTVDKRAAAKVAAKRRRLYGRRLRVLLNRQDWALIARDKALDRLDRIEREIAALDRWFLGGGS